MSVREGVMRALRRIPLEVLQVLIGVFFLCSWEWLGRAGLLSPVFFPTPSVILRTLIRLLSTGELAAHLQVTLARTAAGLFLGGTMGLLIGLPMGWFPRFRRFMDPFVAGFHAVPKISLLPLIMIVAGIGEAPNLVIIALASFFPMAINALAGVQQISPLYGEVARNYGAGPLQTFRRVILPGSLPLLFAGMRLAVNSALVVTIAIELVVAQQGLGSMIWQAWETLRIEALYASILMTAVLGVAFNLILGRLARWAIPWRPI
jgi:ABC-type nitrate/sulfonate/bicarbonate transport system permease component